MVSFALLTTAVKLVGCTQTTGPEFFGLIPEYGAEFTSRRFESRF